MDNNQQIRTAIVSEAERVEEDTEHSFKGHYNASCVWSCIHHGIGIPMSVVAAWASIDAFSQTPTIAGYLALIAATLAAIQTFVNPAEKSAKHKSSGGEYQALRNAARRFREIDLLAIPDNEAISRIREIAEQRDELNRVSPTIPRWAYWRAKKDIDGGLARYRTDEENKQEGK